MVDKQWVDELTFNLNKAKKKQNSKEERFLQLNKVIRIVAKVGDYSNDCDECNSYKKRLEDFSTDPKSYITFNKKLNEFNKFLNDVSKHLETEHKIRPVRYYTSFYSFTGMMVGAILGAGVGYLLNENKIMSGVLIGWIIGLIIGRVVGLKKDSNLKKMNKQY